MKKPKEPSLGVSSDELPAGSPSFRARALMALMQKQKDEYPAQLAEYKRDLAAWRGRHPLRAAWADCWDNSGISPESASLFAALVLFVWYAAFTSDYVPHESFREMPWGIIQ